MKIKVAIVEDNAEARQSWVKLLDTHPRVQCVAACATGEAALDEIPRHRPRVVLMDINLPGMSGIQCAAQLKEHLPEMQILMLTAYSFNNYIFEALKVGASGYLLKSTSGTELIRSIVEAADGGAPMSGQIARRVIEVFRKPAPKAPTHAELTPRENEILHLLSQGYSNKEIATTLGCSTGTVKIHLEHIYQKLHVRGRTEAAAKYFADPKHASPAT